MAAQFLYRGKHANAATARITRMIAVGHADEHQLLLIREIEVDAVREDVAFVRCLPQRFGIPSTLAVCEHGGVDFKQRIFGPCTDHDIDGVV